MSQANDNSDDDFLKMLSAGVESGSRLADAHNSKIQDPLALALLDACRTGTAQTVAELLKKGANPNIAHFDETALSAAIMSEGEAASKVRHLLSAHRVFEWVLFRVSGAAATCT